MKRGQIIILTGCLVVCFGILLALYATSPISKEIPRASFDREFLPSPLIKKAEMDIEYNSFYIAGQTEDHIYLGNVTAPFHLLIANKTLTDSQHVMLKVKLDSIMSPKNFKLTVNPPYFFLSHGVMPKQLRGNVGEWIATDLLGSETPYFTESIPLGASSFALRYYSESQKGYELAKSSLKQPLLSRHELLEKQLDGIFCLDGELHYDKELSQLVYLHYYRNEFTVSDSNLNLIYRGHTIDTFSRARIKVAQLDNGNERTLNAPPMQINGSSCVSGKYLFVRSKLLAKNEIIQDFLDGVDVDIYDLTNGKYLGSFNIPPHKDQKASEFKVLNSRLTVLFDHYLVIYELDLTSRDKELSARLEIRNKAEHLNKPR